MNNAYCKVRIALNKITLSLTTDYTLFTTGLFEVDVCSGSFNLLGYVFFFFFFGVFEANRCRLMININPKRSAGPTTPSSQIKPTGYNFHCSSINSILNIDCIFVCSSFYSRELITRLRRYLFQLITALQYLGIQHRFTMELPHGLR